MQIDVALVPEELTHRSLAHTSVVVIDVLRATSTMVSALANGIKRIYPVATTEEAFALKNQLADSLLCGEVNSLKPEGFDCDNSPIAFTDKTNVTQATLIMRTTNGTRLLSRLKGHPVEPVWMGSFINLEALCQTIATERPSSLLLCCAGTNGLSSLDDIGFAGALIDQLNIVPGLLTRMGDGAIAAQSVWHQVGCDIETLFAHTSHTRTLLDLGKADDVHWIANATLQVVPVWDSATGWITTP